MISRIRVADDRLQAGGSVDVRHGWDDVARLLAYRRHEQHEPRGQLPRRIVEAEEAAGVFHRHGRGEWPVRLAELDLRVHEVFHFGSARIGEAPTAAPPSPADGWTYRSVMGVSRRMRPFATLFRATPPAMHSAVAPVFVCAARARPSTICSVTA